jgi:Macrocin-O-methyltransferase (TylF)
MTKESSIDDIKQGHSTKVANLSSSEKQYQEQRQLLLKTTTSFEVVAAPFVFADRQLITTALTRIHLFEKILEVQGAIVECGVHKANSLFLYYHLSSILEPFNFNRKVIGFDTFEGFRSISNKDDSRTTEMEFSDTDYEKIKMWSKLQDLNKAVPHISKIELVKGDATETIPQFVSENPHLIIALLYLDFDIYAPTCVALKHLLPLVPKGGVVGFDEINCKKWQGETIALKENIVIGNVALRKFYYDPWVSYYVVE